MLIISLVISGGYKRQAKEVIYFYNSYMGLTRVTNARQRTIVIVAHVGNFWKPLATPRKVSNSIVIILIIKMLYAIYAGNLVSRDLIALQY